MKGQNTRSCMPGNKR